MHFKSTKPNKQTNKENPCMRCKYYAPLINQNVNQVKNLKLKFREKGKKNRVVKQRRKKCKENYHTKCKRKYKSTKTHIHKTIEFSKRSTCKRARSPLKVNESARESLN